MRARKTSRRVSADQDVAASVITATTSRRRQLVRALTAGLIACLACDAERVPDANHKAGDADPIDRNASAEDLYFEMVRLRSLGLVSDKRMDALQANLDRIDLEPDPAERARDAREAVASVLRRTLGELAKTVARANWPARSVAVRLMRRYSRG